MPPRASLVVLAFFPLVAGFSAASLAQPLPLPLPPMSGTPEEQAACRPDARRWCRSVLGQDRMVILACLQQNRPRLSQACRAVLGRHGV